MSAAERVNCYSYLNKHLFVSGVIGHLLQPSDAARGASYGPLAEAPQQMLAGFEQVLANTPAQNPQRVADAIAGLIAQPAGQRPFRTTVDALGMGAAVDGYNQALAQLTAGLYGNFGIGHLLTPQIGKAP